MRFFILTAILLLLNQVLLAQDPYAIVISRSNGLPSNSAYQIFQDSRGFIWVTSNEGLSRFDGYKFRTYTSKEQSSIAGTEIHEDKYGRIWYQNFDGFLYYVAQDTLRKLEQNEPIGYFHYGIIDNKLFVIQKHGVDVYDLRSLRRLKTIHTDLSSLRSSQQTRSYLYLFSDRLCRIDTSGKIEVLEHPSFEKDNLPTLMQTNGDELFMVSKANKTKRCYHVKGNRMVDKFRLSDSIGLIQSLAFTDSTYWFCTPRGVYGYKNDGSPINTGLFKEKNIAFVLCDREKNYWFTTKNQGLLLVPNLKTFVHKTGFKPGKILVYDSTLYVGTKNDEIYEVDLVTHASKQIYKGGSGHEIYNLVCDTVNRYLMFTAWDFRMTDLKGRPVFKWTSSVKDLCRVDDKYYAYAATGTVGFFTLNQNLKSKWDFFLKTKTSKREKWAIRLLNGVRGKSVAFNAKENYIYYATSNGLFRVDTVSVKEIRHRNNSVYLSKLQECANRIFGLDAQGNIYEIINDSLEILPVLGKELEDGEIKDIKSTGGFLFLKTLKELYCVKPSKKEMRLNKIPISVPPSEISDISLWKGSLILATETGLLFPEFNIQARSGVSPLFVINSVKVNGEIINTKKPLNLAYNENNIEIDYSILCFRNGSEYPLFYKINDQSWELTSPESRVLKLASLSPGLYTIVFRLGELPVVENSSGIKFEIVKPWWAQYWFIGICFISFFGVVYTYYKWQITLLYKRNKLLSEKIELEKHLNASILTSIRSQMNPHFFYNALNTIQSFIFSDDKKNAAVYLSKFSKLTRTILEHSERERIPLTEEIMALTLYLEIEKVRFNDDFDFRIHVNEHLDKDQVRIPPMLIQPYVENAIRHGLLHKKEKKELHIDFKQEDGFLTVIVDDNGIGRKRSEELNRTRQGAHRSFASTANQTRLEILNKDSRTKTAVRYIDKTDWENSSIGTTVIIHIPMNKL